MGVLFSHCSRLTFVQAVAVPLAALVALALLLAACSGTDSPPRVVVVTSTHTPGPAGVVHTATDVPPPDAGQSEPTRTSLPAATGEQPTTTTEQPAATVEQPAATAQQPTATAQQPTETAEQPTVSVQPTATSAPNASLADYRVVYGNFDGGDQADGLKYSVWMMRGDGQEARQLLHPAFEPSFSADGNRIAYYQPFNGIWIYDLATGSDTHIVVSNYAEFGGFSPDGQRLVFHDRFGSQESYAVYLYVANADGSGLTQLVQGIRPAWSPTGELIVFDSCQGASCGIFAVQSDGQGFMQVTDDAGGKASWAPNGNQIVYSADADGDPEIWIVNLDGTGQKQLTNNKGNDTLPVFSPDGQFIYFLSDQDGTAWAIRAMRLDGSDVRTIQQMGVPPRWQFSRLWVTWW